MKAARLYNLKDIRIEEVALPEIAADEALVRMKACGICGSDTMAWYVHKKAPFYLGHEPAGIIAEVGQQVQNFKVGERVFVHHHAPCFDCKYCRKKQYSLCPTWKASKIDPGGIAEFFRVPALNLRGDTLKLPRTLSFADGALIEPTACVVKAFRQAKFQRQDSVLVIGLGGTGQMHILLVQYYGARQILGVDLVTVGPGTTAAMQTGISCVGKGGTVLFFTPTPDDERLTINPYHFYFNEIILTCSYSCGPHDTLRIYLCDSSKA